MSQCGHAVKDLLMELAQTERKTIPPYQTEKVQRVKQQIREHNQEMTRLIQGAEQKVRERA